MKNTRDNGLSDRRKAAADAKKALLETYRAKAADPGLAEKLAERQAIASAREERRAERERAKKEEQERILKEAAERTQAAAAEQLAEARQREEADRNRVARVIEDEAARKAERDRRYANRKARKG